MQEVLAEGRLRPRVVVAVDLFGQPADYAAVRAVTDRYGLLVLEDGAQGFGGTIGGKRACSFGDISTTSFFPAKPLGCYGDGGAVFTDNEAWAALIDSYRVHGKGQFKYDNVRIGLNSRLDTVQAAILQVKLKAFAEYELDAVNEVAARYAERLQGAVHRPFRRPHAARCRPGRAQGRRHSGDGILPEADAPADGVLRFSRRPAASSE